MNSLEDRTLLSAQPFVVGTTLDVVDAEDGVTSLREAIANANAEPGVQEITFDLPAGSVIQLTQGELLVTESVTLTGLGIGQTIVDADLLSRVFDVPSNQTLTLEHLTVRRGQAAQGGAIRGAVSSTIVLQNASLEANQATDGGAIYTSGRVQVIDSTLFDNSASNNGGAIYRAGNSGTRSISIVNSDFTSNSAGQHAGAIFIVDNSLAISASKFASNSAQLAGGAIRSSSGTAGYLGLHIQTSDFLNNSAKDTGGAISLQTHTDFTVTDSHFEGNQVSERPNVYAAFGGAIHVSKSWSSQTAHVRTTINRSTFVSNRGIGPSGSGGAISQQGGEMTIRNSTIGGNDANSGGGIRTFSGSISGIHSLLSLDHATITSNTATGSGAGGGIYSGDAATIHNSIVAGNTANSPGSFGIDITGALNTASSFNVIGHQCRKPRQHFVHRPAGVLATGNS